MSEVEWSRVLRKQDEYVHNIDQQQLSYRKNIKNLYKQQLDRQIEQHRKNSKNQKQEDKRLMQYAQRINQFQEKMQKQKNNNIHIMNEKLARDNLKSFQNRRRKYRLETQGVKNFYSNNFQRLQTQIQQQSRSRMNKREKQKKLLSGAYEEQIHQHEHRKFWEKHEDQKMMNLLKQIEDRKQKQRQKYFQRIRSYQQNPEVYNNVKNIKYKNQHNRSQFLDKITNFDNMDQIEKMKTMEHNQKMKKLKQVSEFNHSYGEEKKIQQRHQSLQEVAEYNRKFDELNRQIRRQRMQKQKQSQYKRIKLKEELQHQIQDIEKKKKRLNTLDDRQYKLNKGENVPALPGLWKDHAAIKQQNILQNFLKGKSAYK